MWTALCSVCRSCSWVWMRLSTQPRFLARGRRDQPSCRVHACARQRRREQSCRGVGVARHPPCRAPAASSQAWQLAPALPRIRPSPGTHPCRAAGGGPPGPVCAGQGGGQPAHQCGQHLSGVPRPLGYRGAGAQGGAPKQRCASALPRLPLPPPSSPVWRFLCASPLDNCG